MTGFRPDWAERIQRGRTRAWGRGYLKGYDSGLIDGRWQLRLEIIESLLKDAVVTTTVDVQTLETIVKIVEEA